MSKMTTIKEKLYFNFDGQESKDFGIIAVDLSSNLYEEIFAPTRTINQTQTVKGNRVIFHDVKEELRSFELNLAFEEGFSDELLDDVSRWLFKDYYKPLYFEGQEDRIMFAMASGDSTLTHNGLNEGYFTITIQANSPYLYSQLREGGSTIDGNGEIAVNNNGHLDIYPELSITKIGNGDLTIGIDSRNVKITNLTDGESIYIDTDREIIETDVIGEHRYNNIVSGELEDLFIGFGNKVYVVEGGAEITYRFREIYRV